MGAGRHRWAPGRDADGWHRCTTCPAAYRSVLDGGKWRKEWLAGAYRIGWVSDGGRDRTPPHPIVRHDAVRTAPPRPGRPVPEVGTRVWHPAEVAVYEWTGAVWTRVDPPVSDRSSG
jgi:hypothetical protein